MRAACADELEAAIAALAAPEGVETQQEPIGYTNPNEYATFASGEDHTFVVYRHGVHGKDVAIYAAAGVPTR
jgi:hypothetical protein